MFVLYHEGHDAVAFRGTRRKNHGTRFEIELSQIQLKIRFVPPRPTVNSLGTDNDAGSDPIKGTYRRERVTISPLRRRAGCALWPADLPL